MPTSSTKQLIEVSFPDKTVSRYSPARVRELLDSKKLEVNWPARIAGTQEWFNLSTCLNGEQAKPQEAVSAPSVRNSIQIESARNLEAREHALTFGADEAVIASIGQHAVVGLLKTEGISSTHVVLTEKRIYVRGRAIRGSGSEELRLVGDLSSVCCLSLHNYSNWFKICMGIFLLFVAFVAAGNKTFPAGVVAAVSFFGGSWAMFSFFMTRRRYLRINISGDGYDVGMQGVDNEEVLNFIDKTMAHVIGTKTQI